MQIRWTRILLPVATQLEEEKRWLTNYNIYIYTLLVTNTIELWQVWYLRSDAQIQNLIPDFVYVLIFKVHTPTEWGPSLAGASASELYLSFFSPSSNWLGQVMWHKKYWWHHSVLSTRPHSSTSLVTSVNVSFCRLRPPEVSFEYYTWFWLTQLNSTQL